MHTHTFFEVALVLAGEGVHQSLAGRQQLRIGDVVLLRYALSDRFAPID